MKWFRMYAEIRTDPKVQKLHPQLFKFWVNLLALACELDSNGVLPPLEDLAYLMGVRHDVLVRFTSTLASRQLLDRSTSGVLSVHGWLTRQKSSDRGAERVKRYRERTSEKRHQSDVTLQKTNSNGPVTALEGEGELEGELVSLSARTHAREEQLSEVNPPQPPSTPQRSPEDQAEFDAACKTLASDLRTEWLGIELGRRATLPEVLGWEGWRFRRAAEVIMSAKCTDGQRKNLPYFLGIVEKAELARASPMPSANGNGKPKMTDEDCARWAEKMREHMRRNP